jgi:leucyl-tRNA synthetase
MFISNTHFDFNYDIGESNNDKVEVFTTRCDTLLGVTYLVLAPEHPLVNKLTTPEHVDSVNKYVNSIAGKSDLERTSTGLDKGK